MSDQSVTAEAADNARPRDGGSAKESPPRVGPPDGRDCPACGFDTYDCRGCGFY